MQGTQRHRRVKLIGPAEVWPESADLPVEAYVLNLSYSGMAVQTRKPVAGRVEITLFFADGHGGRVGEALSGHVVWCRTFDLFYRAGIEFDGLTPHDHPLILRTLRAFTGPAEVQGRAQG